MAKRITKISTAILEKGSESASYMGVTEKKEYSNGTATGRIESVALDVAIENAGICQIVLPYREGLASEIDQQLSFAERFNPSELFNISDIQIGIYNEQLNIKYIATEL